MASAALKPLLIGNFDGFAFLLNPSVASAALKQIKFGIFCAFFCLLNPSVASAALKQTTQIYLRSLGVSLKPFCGFGCIETLVFKNEWEIAVLS